MRTARRRPLAGLPLARPLAAGALVVATVAGLAAGPAAAADAPAGLDHTRELGQFGDWWTAAAYDKTNADTVRATAFKGTVSAAGAGVLGRNDELVQGINHAGAADPAQRTRALIDADMIWQETLGDALGPTLSGYFREGVAQEKLPKTVGVIEGGTKSASTGTAKTDFNFPRPFLKASDAARGGVGDRSRNGQNDLHGLAPQLDITRVADEGARPDNGKPHSAEYDDLAGLGTKGITGLNQAFPSGHTTFAYGIGLALAELLPELGPEIVTRTSEAGNNRVVLGVHYPLDVMGGRIAGHSNTAAVLSGDGFLTGTLEPARRELVDYLTGRCSADGHGTTLAACITETGANDKGGYTNPFVDPVSTAPVTDRASALAAYTARMRYGFASTAPGAAPRVPAGAPVLLATAFPELDDAQRAAVIAATEIDSGLPLDASSGGWQRVNLAAAMSAKVTVDTFGNVVKVEPGAPAPSVVRLPAPAGLGSLADSGLATGSLGRMLAGVS